MKINRQTYEYTYKEQREKTTKIRNDSGDITSHFTEIKMVIRNYYE